MMAPSHLYESIWAFLTFDKDKEQAGAELCQAQISFQLAMKASRIWNLALDVLNEIKKIYDDVSQTIWMK